MSLLQEDWLTGGVVPRKLSKAAAKKDKRDRSEYYLRNRAKYVANGRKNYLKNRDRVLAKSRARKGIPEADRPMPATCECCGRTPGKVMLAIDHDHNTGKFRGWLCIYCNTGIGKLGDSIAGLRTAIAYLERAK